jgi:hypothetical protein
MSLRTSLTQEARHWPEQEPLTNHQGMSEKLSEKGSGSSETLDH